MWVAGVANLTDLGENHRFRYLSDALVVILLARGARFAYARWKSPSRVAARQRERGPAAPDPAVEH